MSVIREYSLGANVQRRFQNGNFSPWKIFIEWGFKIIVWHAGVYRMKPHTSVDSTVFGNEQIHGKKGQNSVLQRATKRDSYAVQFGTMNLTNRNK